MRMKIHHVALFCCLLSLAELNFALAADEYRTFSDAKGQNTIKAKFVKLENETVTLEQEDGEEVEIELKLLSTADQKFVKEAVKRADGSPFKAKSSVSSKGKSEGVNKNEKMTPRKSDESDDSGEVKTLKLKLKDAKIIKLNPGTKGWKVEIPNRESPSASEGFKSIELPAKRDFFENISSMVLSHGQKKSGVVGYNLKKPGLNSTTTTRVLAVNLDSQQPGDDGISEKEFRPLALHDDGRQIVMLESGFGNGHRLEVWTIEGEKISKAYGWLPYEGDKGWKDAVEWAEFLDEGKLLTCSNRGRVAIWKFPEIRPLGVFETGFGCTPALSADRKLLAYSDGASIGLMEIARQKAVVLQQLPFKMEYPKLSFSPSSKFLAAATINKLVVFNVANGKVEHSIPYGITNARVQFVDDNFILLGNSTLIDLEHEIFLWTYQGADDFQVVDGVPFFLLGAAGCIISSEIPHQAAKDALASALASSDDFVLKPGTNVRIDVSGIPDASQRQQVSSNLAKQLKEQKCSGGATGTIDLIASIEGPKEIEVTYIHAGTHKFKEYTSRLKLVYESKTVWEKTNVNTPSVANLKKGENIETYLRGQEKPTYEIFENSLLPKYVLKPTDAQRPLHLGTIGFSNLTPKGVQ